MISSTSKPAAGGCVNMPGSLSDGEGLDAVEGEAEQAAAQLVKMKAKYKFLTCTSGTDNQRWSSQVGTPEGRDLQEDDQGVRCISQDA